MQYYRKEKDFLPLTYHDKVQLVALWKQISCGKYDDSKVSEIGYFDVIGNDRRKAWGALADMAPDVAKEKFCNTLEKNCPNYTEFVANRKREFEAEIERKRKFVEERKRKEEEERRRREEEEKIRREEEERIRLSLETERLKLEEEQEEARHEAMAEQELKENRGTDAPKLVTPQINGATTGRTIAPASLWTRPKLQEFINHVKRDASSVLVVGRGETVTIRVPTHENGSCLFWEFATESYDVGFGVYFEWSTSKSPAISVKVNESDNDETNTADEMKTNGVEQIVVNENENNVEVMDKPNTDEVLPVLRRNSHAEVIVGSHMYPGQGIYLLKFDNSYSLLRSKTLYYRVYYTK